MDRKTVYIETSVVSYLTARRTGDLVAAAWQKVTVDWWGTKPVMRRVCAEYGHAVPEICTPHELMGGFDDGG